jgi:hypothetical protein
MLQAISSSPALVTRPCERDDAARYLLIAPEGGPRWVHDPEQATAFASMREATRMALRLPSALRAFGLPRAPELGAQLH